MTPNHQIRVGPEIGVGPIGPTQFSGPYPNFPNRTDPKHRTNHNFENFGVFCDFFGRVGRIIFAIMLIVVFKIFGTSLNVLFLVLVFGIFLTYGLHFLEEEK